MKKEIQRFENILKENGYKLTSQRKSTLAVIIENEDKHLSVDDIVFYLQDYNPDIGVATVYRTVMLFEELGILVKHDFEDGRNRYELSHPDEDHDHHHLICLKCGDVIEVEDDLLDYLENSIENKIKFKVINHKVKFYGYCINCRNKKITNK